MISIIVGIVAVLVGCWSIYDGATQIAKYKTTQKFFEEVKKYDIPDFVGTDKESMQNNREAWEKYCKDRLYEVDKYLNTIK